MFVLCIYRSLKAVTTSHVPETFQVHGESLLTPGVSQCRHRRNSEHLATPEHSGTLSSEPSDGGSIPPASTLQGGDSPSIFVSRGLPARRRVLETCQWRAGFGSSD